MGGQYVESMLDRLPNLRALKESGAWTLEGEAVDPTVSGPNWSAIVAGIYPRTSGIWGNGAVRGNIPSMFDALRAQRPDAFTAAATSWNWIDDYFTNSKTEPSVDLSYSWSNQEYET